MEERKPDTVITIPIGEYRELLTTSVQYTELLSRYWNLQAQLKQSSKAPCPGINQPYFGSSVEDKDETVT